MKITRLYGQLAWFLAEEVTLTMLCTHQVSVLSTNCTAPRLKLVVLTHPWTKLDTEVRVYPYMASCSWKNIAFVFVNMQVVSRDWRWDHEKFLRLSWPVVPAKVTPARDQQSLCHWLTLRPAQRLFWDAMTLLPLSFIKVAMGTIAFFMLADRRPNCQPQHSSDETTQTQILPS